MNVLFIFIVVMWKGVGVLNIGRIIVLYFLFINKFYIVKY